jgi:translation initiation factor RLI1
MDPTRSPQSLLTGMNQFLASLEITFRRDPTNYRPRVNKMNSLKDREQKCKLGPYEKTLINKTL